MRSISRRNRAKNIRIHLTVSRVRFRLLPFQFIWKFCDGGAIYSRGRDHSQRNPQHREHPVWPNPASLRAAIDLALGSIKMPEIDA
jgi:hypothetical protein